MDMSVSKRTRRRAGFSLAETLLAVLILSIAAMLLANGVPFAKSAYEDVVVSANARMLLSNTVSALRNELGTAMNVVVDPVERSIVYYSTDIHSNSKIYLYQSSVESGSLLVDEAETDPQPNGTIMLQQYYTIDANVANLAGLAVQPRRLVTTSASNGNLYITFDQIGLNGSLITISGLKVFSRTDTAEVPHALASLDELVLHPVVGPVATAVPRAS